MQIKVACHHRHAEEDENPLGERDRTRILKHHIDAVENERDNQNIENIQRRNGRQNAAELCRHRKIKRHKDPPRRNYPSRHTSPYILAGRTTRTSAGDEHLF